MKAERNAKRVWYRSKEERGGPLEFCSISGIKTLVPSFL
jgi:hypothetical protein